MKIIMYLVIICLTAVIVFLTNQMQDRSFNSYNMRSAYFNGCNFGTIAGTRITTQTVTRCKTNADGFKEILDKDVN